MNDVSNHGHHRDEDYECQELDRVIERIELERALNDGGDGYEQLQDANGASR
jgi:hypothetical protein